MLVIHNTLSGREEVFQPLEEGKVKMYVCGPTVYDRMHIGNARPVVVFDVVHRFFKYSGYDITFVQNYTDIDDKIIARAAAAGVSTRDYAEKYIVEAEIDTEGLNALPAIHPRATEEIAGMIEMIKLLMAKGYAYENAGTVFFMPEKFAEYGKLSGKNLEELEAGSRVEVDDQKRSPFDFVLWKPKKEGEPYWTSPWGDGRPGWHLECSEMAKKYLGTTIDIHGGGTDLIFPHHENEIAQSECANDEPFARYFMHNGFINIDNKKMSKSANNFFTIREIAEEYPYPVIRFLLLSAQYRKPLNFSHDLMESARQSFTRLSNAWERLQELGGVPAIAIPNIDTDYGCYPELADRKAEFIKALEADFNTPDALTALFELAKICNTNLSRDSENDKIKAYADLFAEMSWVLGLDFKQEKVLLDAEILRKIEERQNARKAKDFALADKIRQELLDQGIVLEDTREGVKYKRV
ncbi:cysteine--tRNA ligase [Clostridiales bacterium COT073_COT-073]|nr:cysteine--tRNA ligase [Clostridiales bacterium COT073_COT-073]